MRQDMKGAIIRKRTEEREKRAKIGGQGEGKR